MSAEPTHSPRLVTEVQGKYFLHSSEKGTEARGSSAGAQGQEMRKGHIGIPKPGPRTTHSHSSLFGAKPMFSEFLPVFLLYICRTRTLPLQGTAFYTF